MTTTPDIRLSVEVRQVLGIEGVQQVLAAPLAHARCPVCRKHVRAAGPVNVVISISGPASVVTFCHPGCAPSSLMGADFDLSELLPDVSHMQMTALLLPHGGALLPVLVAEQPLRAWRSPGGNAEVTNLVVSTLLTRGFAPVLRLRDAPRAMLAQPGVFTYTETGLSQLLIEPTPGDLFYDGTVNIAPAWRAAAERYSWCVLYSGSNLSDPATENITEPILKAAAAAGTLAGTRLRTNWNNTSIGIATPAR